MKIELTDEMLNELEKQYEEDKLANINFYKTPKFTTLLNEIKEKDISFSTEDLTYKLSSIQSLFNNEYSYKELHQFIEIVKSKNIIENSDYQEIDVDEEDELCKEVNTQLGLKVVSIYGQGSITYIEKI